MKRNALAICAALALPGAVSAKDVSWRFDSLSRIGGAQTQIEGAPRIVQGPDGPAIEFDGKNDSIKILDRPLNGARRFTIQVLIRPDGGENEQRFLHLAQTDPITGLDSAEPGAVDRTPRIMYEIRVVGDKWYPDAFVDTSAGNGGVIIPEASFAVGKWYALAQTYDGKTLRSYVNGKLQGVREVAFAPLKAGHARIGARMNLISHFHGAIGEILFSDKALRADQLRKLPE